MVVIKQRCLNEFVVKIFFGVCHRIVTGFIMGSTAMVYDLVLGARRVLYVSGLCSVINICFWVVGGG